MVSDRIEFAVGDIEKLFDEARRNTKAKHEKWANYYDNKRRHVRIRVNDWVLVQTHLLSSATKKVVAKFKPKFEGPYKVLKVQHNNLLVWKAGKRLTVNIVQVRLYHQKKSDENVISVRISNGSGSGYQASSFEGVRPRSYWSQNSKNNGSGERREVKGKRTGLKKDRGDGRTTVTDKRKPHVGSSKESSPQISSILKSRKEVIGHKRSVNTSRSGGPERKRSKVPVKQGDKRNLSASANCSNYYRKKFHTAEADIGRYTLWSKVKEAAESRPSRGKMQDQGVPVRLR
ncbi:uncharacterized protein TNCV_3897571 [Trichonephila clavipes]|nr:uncharacterized protein TNCV_3897571 [Trichonephila clavipes]